MPTGFNQYCDVHRYSFGTDDRVGGAMPTGTLVYCQVPMRIEPIEPTIALMEQGLETPHLYRAAISIKAAVLKENDEVEVVLPVESWYYGYRFRVASVRHASLRPGDPRSQTLVIMRRMDEAHGRNISS